MKTIKFLQRVPPYQAGELAGFPDRDADRLIASGAAEEVEVRISRRGGQRGAPRTPVDPVQPPVPEGGDGGGGEGGERDESGAFELGADAS